jgi:GrpB-like predicted nucleotidyltransferase (UPF0157 family)
MTYGAPLKSTATYKKIFAIVKAKITKARKGVIVEHVGGTSLKKPLGKGDVDVYVSFANKANQKELQKVLTKLFGKPGKITPNRVRYSLYVDGVEVEIQLTTPEQLKAAVALRNYLDAHPLVAKQYADSILKLRTQFLAKQFKLKADFVQKALNAQSRM